LMRFSKQVIFAAIFIDRELSKHHLLTTDRESLAWCIKSLSQSNNLPRKQKNR
jgi:hypothetical protein